MSEPGGRILALDLGEVRIGIALSDPLGVTAQPAGYVRRRGAAADLQEIRSLVAKHDVRLVVVGHPLLLSGARGTGAGDAERFAGRLRAKLPAAVAVSLWDERMTTAEAERVLVSDGVRRRRRREVVDAMAAVLILQSWLDAHGGGPERPADPSGGEGQSSR